MKYLYRVICAILIIVLTTILLSMVMKSFQKDSVKENTIEEVTPFNIDSSDYIYVTEDNYYKDILERAKSMTEVKWTTKKDLKGFKNSYVFKAGQIYTGIPYSQGTVQVSSTKEFLDKISSGKNLYGNDCSGFVSFSWGIGRQTTLSLYNAVKKGKKLDGKSIIQVNWDEIKGGDALIKENGNGNGHIVIFNKRSENNNDTIYVYEQNIAIPGKALIPSAREDTQSINALIKLGYFPIRIAV